MRPPFCAVCDQIIDPQNEGGLVRFADYTPLPDNMTGHPQGLEWFCPDHIAQARDLHHLSCSEAVRWIKETPGG